MTASALDASQIRTVTAVMSSPVETVYALVADVERTADFSGELVSVRWDHRRDPARVSVGDRFSSRNKLSSMTWTSSSVVVAADPRGHFAFAVNGSEHPTAVWTFQLSPASAAGQTSVRYTVELGDGPSMIDVVTDGDPARRAAAVSSRLDMLEHDMRIFLAAIHRTLSGHPADPSQPAPHAS